ncbi:MAG: DUF4282 domain-containing protein [Gemmata sp.]
MNNTCPKCATGYNVSAAAVGRKFTCKNCGTPVVVTAAGLEYQTPAAPEPAAAPAGGSGAFDFDNSPGEREPKPVAKAAKPAKPAKRARDAEVAEPPADLEDEEFDGPPQRKPKKAAKKGMFMDFVLFREFIAPLFVKVIFVIAVLVIVGSGLLAAVLGVLSGRSETILSGLVALVVGVPFSLLMARIYCEIMLLAFSLYDRLGEIKALLEKQNTPPAP